MIFVITTPKRGKTLNNMLKSFLSDKPYKIIDSPEKIEKLQNKKILFALDLDEAGFCHEVNTIMSKLFELGKDSLLNSTAAILIHSPNYLFTKSQAQSIIFLANSLGCRFIGHPLVEAIKDFKNFQTWQKTINLSLEEICYDQCRILGDRLWDFDNKKPSKPKLLALHASNKSTSNTLMLWHMVMKNLCEFEIKELHVENGTVLDCIGCSFKTCIHFSKQRSCFYGGIMVEEVYPEVEKSDIIMWICPNYNDAISANLTAVINRLTALYRKMKFYDKRIYSIVVSGNSGSDNVAKQLLGALNINKGFILPPYFLLSEIANDPGTILKVQNIENKALDFALKIKREIFAD
ncbi:NAD(P)H-dependent oxidoreductase [Caloramator sp. CAR-1]|uniref:flavodoxin family protein n=1 Tax=Caloramator sp. CAR-1 TaxID=3062777 RepID=UPI0026E23BE9|nr:NAD(P)H-dependent oxidoreductase [Caloramator sp. CAR-1]MDO6354201.1 NAD(P)H-dependent oxidoreductase [Caloramator sp. CAR-1]